MCVVHYIFAIKPDEESRIYYAKVATNTLVYGHFMAHSSNGCGPIAVLTRSTKPEKIYGFGVVYRKKTFEGNPLLRFRRT
jgi:hypothetical protein